MSDKIHDQREDARFRVLRLLQGNPNCSQRDIANTLNISLGGINFCLNALIEKGHIKTQNFRTSGNKLRYAYVLTPKGIMEKTILTGRFLQRKMREYEMLKTEIKAVQEEMEITSKPDRHTPQITNS